MSAFVQRSLAVVVLISSAAVVSGRALGQAGSAPSTDAAKPVEQPEEVTVRGRKTVAQYRLELERQRDEIFRIFNEANQGTDNDIRCRDEQPTGRRIRQTVCRSNAEETANARATRDFVRSLFATTGGYSEGFRLGTGTPGAGGPQVNANIGTGRAQQDGKSGEATAFQKWEAEWNRMLSENRDLFRAVTHYVEIEQEYIRARGDTPAPGADLLAAPVVLEQAPAPGAGPVCEATSLTEYEQRNNVARVSGTVSISSCPAGTTGSFTLIARVRDDTGEVRPIEFEETWERADTADHRFEHDYPIGDDVFLQSVRVRGLTCTCAEPAQ
jgi:hypothetical protein